jgi:hypothetical protein
VKIKVNVVLERATETHREGGGGQWMYSYTVSLILALDGVGGPPHALAAFRDRPDTYCTGGWVGSRAGLDGCGKSRQPIGDSNPGPLRLQGVAISTELSWPTFPKSGPL